MIDELYSNSNYSFPYRSQTAWPNHFAGILGTRRDFACYHPVFDKKNPTRQLRMSEQIYFSVRFSYLVQSFASFVMFSFPGRHTTNVHSHFIVHLDGDKIMKT